MLDCLEQATCHLAAAKLALAIDQVEADLAALALR
jgi:hypothetical protein